MNEIYWGQTIIKQADAVVDGAIVEVDGEKYYRVRHYDRMPPFLMSVVSSSDHWMFVSSSGGLSCGRANPDRALFPYCTDDKVHDSASHTGPKTCLLVEKSDKTSLWIPFSDGVAVYATERSLYKSIYGSRLIFEEVNHDLGLVYSYQWAPGERFGFIKAGRLQNIGAESVTIQLLDGLRNLLPPGVGQDMQSRLSTLVDAYKKSEVHSPSGAGIYSLNSLPSDRAEPREALEASVACSVGLTRPVVLLSEKQVKPFCDGQTIQPETLLTGRRGAYFVRSGFVLSPAEQKNWYLVSDLGLGASALTRYLERLGRKRVEAEIEADISAGEQRLRELAGSADGFQYTSDDRVSGRHFANTLFNIMRGGTFIDGYNVPREDFLDFVSALNAPLREPYEALLANIPDPLTRDALRTAADSSGHADMKRLALEYLPLTFSRRHGDPSRPWNKFHIDVLTESGERKLGYAGNWRDIFQNWEALGFSYPEFVESFVCRFVNASTVDGYNPYRISRDGFDWEVLDPDDDWSNIGYWGDHQAVYLQRLLEWSRRFYPGRISRYLGERIFVYADVPYRIKPYRELLHNPRDSIVYDTERARRLAVRSKEIGADGKLLTLPDGSICKANLLEKLLVTVLCKLGNFVPGGGIWMNTQRPEWNDANNALAGFGLSVVTVNYLRRLLLTLAELVEEAEEDSYAVTEEIMDYLLGVSRVLAGTESAVSSTLSSEGRKKFMDEMGQLGSGYRARVYEGLSGTEKALDKQQILDFVDGALAHLDNTIRINRRPDGLYHSYNLVQFGQTGHTIKRLSIMLEGQVAVLGSGLLGATDSLALLDALKESDLYRADQHSYMLYPDRQITGFLDKNVVPDSVVAKSQVIKQELSSGRSILLEQDPQGRVHFNSALSNAGDLRAAITRAGDLGEEAKQELCEIYESVFRHREFTGRSGTMFKYEGLGCIYWHMVSKLLLAVSEVSSDVREAGAEQSTLEALAVHIEDIRKGLGLHKSPAEHGAIPLEPYSHTPGFAGAQQPGMTGQVKEDILARFIELGVSVKQGCLAFEPWLLGNEEFAAESGMWRLSSMHGQREEWIEAQSLAFTVCGTPVIYRLCESSYIAVHTGNESPEIIEGASLGRRWSRSLFEREGSVQKIIVGIPQALLQ